MKCRIVAAELLIAGVLWGNETELLTAPRLPPAPVLIDGRLNEPQWNEAAVYRDMHELGSRKPVRIGSELRIFHDSECLYVAITANEPEPAKLKMDVKPGETARYPFIYENDDVVNLFLAESRRSFCQISFIPANVVVFNGARPTTVLYENWWQEPIKEKWEPVIESGVHISDDGWTVEWKLRLADFEYFRSNGWKINLCRERRAGEHQYSTLFPMSGNRFNDYRQYGRLKLEGVTLPGTPDEEAALPELAPERVSDWTSLTGTVEKSGDSFRIRERGKYFSFNAMPIREKAVYRLSGEFRAPAAQQSGPVYFGLMMLDSDNREILPQTVQTVPGSFTELAAGTDAGDSEIRVGDGHNWRTGPDMFVAFQALENLSDLPNFNLSYAAGVQEISREGDVWRIKLSDSHRFTGDAGTAVREHFTGSSYLYLNGQGISVPVQWKRFSAEISGTESRDALKTTCFWPGTRSVKLLFWLTEDSPIPVEFRNVRFEESR